MRPVELKKRRLMVANSKWRVYFDHLIDMRGNEVRDFMVIACQAEAEHRVTGVAVLPIVGDQIVLIRSYRHALETEGWEVPHGFIESGETYVEAALRELAEETGLVCAPADLEPLGFYAPEASSIAARGALFVARQASGIPREPKDEVGLMQVRGFTRGEVEELVANGDIEDAATLITYYRYCGLADVG